MILQASAKQGFVFLALRKRTTMHDTTQQ